MITSKRILCSALVLGSIATVASCGGSEKQTNKRSNDAVVAPPFNPEDPYIVRGHWEIQMANGSQQNLNSMQIARALLGTGQSQAPMVATVAKTVRFTVDQTNFITPTTPEGTASYGTLDITTLQDNSLKECGPAADQKCTTGAIRIYTTGTPGPGLWNAADQYGLPITSGTANIGLNSAGAYTAATATIGSKNILKLADFNVGSKLQIPVAANFDDAAAGSYATTVVVEYVIQ